MSSSSSYHYKFILILRFKNRFLVKGVSSLEKLQRHLDILEKVEKYERKSEFNRFLLILCVSGFVTFIGGWVAYIFNRFFGIDPTFFLFNLTNNPSLTPTKEPILFITVWLIYLIPIVSVVIFSTGTTGIVNWNKAYRGIALMAVFLFFVVHLMILIIGLPNSKYIPAIWGVVVGIGFIAARWPLKSVTENTNLLNGLVILGLIALILGVMVSLLIPTELAQLVFGSALGLALTCVGLIGYIFVGRST